MKHFRKLQVLFFVLLLSLGFAANTQLCQTHLDEYIDSLAKGELWALTMFDATSKLQSGISHGNLNNLGDFDLCLEVEHNSTNGLIRGQYCRGMLNIPFGQTAKNKEYIDNIIKSQSLMTMKRNGGYQAYASTALTSYWSFCIPDTCSCKEGASYLNDKLSFLGLLLPILKGLEIVEIPKVGFEVHSVESTTQPFDGRAIAASVFFILIVVIMMLQTAYDAYLYYNDKEPLHDLLIAFSIIRNGKKLVTVHRTKDMLSCLDGIRVITLLWVIYCHRLSTAVLFFGVVNLLDVYEWTEKLYTMYLGGGPLSVDTFFLIGGLLVTYTFLRSTAKGIPFNVPLFYIHRYLRLTPSLAALTLFSALINPYLGRGPEFKFVTDSLVPCRDWWWSTLLYIQNWTNQNAQCLGHVWYLNVDMQLYLLAPLILIPLSKWPRKTLVGIVFLTLASLGSCFYISKHYELHAISTSYYRNDTHYGKYYIHPHTRSNVWLIGLITGYFVFQIKTNAIRLKLNKYLNVFLLALSGGALIMCTFVGHGTLRGPEYDAWGNALHLTFIRPTWAIALSWIIIACISGHAEPINWFFSLPIFTVLNRLSYSIYLIHLTVIIQMIFTERSKPYFSDYNMMFITAGDFVMTLLICIPWVLAFEYPIVVIEKVLFGRYSRPKPKEAKVAES